MNSTEKSKNFVATHLETSFYLHKETTKVSDIYLFVSQKQYNYLKVCIFLLVEAKFYSDQFVVTISRYGCYLPQNSIAVVKLVGVFFVVEIRLSYCDQSMFSWRNVSFSNSIITAYIPRINSWVIGRLYATTSFRAAFKETIAICVCTQFASGNMDL